MTARREPRSLVCRSKLLAGAAKVALHEGSIIRGLPQGIVKEKTIEDKRMVNSSSPTFAGGRWGCFTLKCRVRPVLSDGGALCRGTAVRTLGPDVRLATNQYGTDWYNSNPASRKFHIDRYRSMRGIDATHAQTCLTACRGGSGRWPAESLHIDR